MEYTVLKQYLCPLIPHNFEKNIMEDSMYWGF